MINLWDIRYVRLGTPRRSEAEGFAISVLGLERVREEAGAVYFKSDWRDHTLVYFDGDPSEQALGFEVRTAEELRRAGDELSNAGVEVQVGTAAQCELRRVRDYIAFRDPTGNVIELVVGPHHSGRRYFPSRDAGITSFSHVGLCTSDPVRDEAFWTGQLGARVSDRIGTAPLLRIDEIHHKIALFPSRRKGVQHVNFQVESIDDVMRAWYILRERGVKVVFGPGRHPTSGAMFLYFEGPQGMIYEYSTGVRTITAEQEATYQPRQFPNSRDSYCMWGAAPDIAEFQDKAK